MTKNVSAKTWALEAVNGRRYSAGAPVGGDSALDQAFAALAPGEDAAFAEGAETVFSDEVYAWQTIGHYDEVNGLVHVLGKRANAPTEWSHRYYTIATGEWTTVGLNMFNNDGHIYGNSALDTVMGHLYLTTEDALRRWTPETGWETPITDLHPTTTTHKNGVAFHPNLFGPGQRGVVIQAVQLILYFNPATGAMATPDTAPLSTGANAGAGIYFEAIDKTITGYQNHVLVSPGPTFEQVDSPPIWTRGYSSGSPEAFGAMVQHPTDASKMLILERNSSVSTARRVWSTTDGDAWTLEAFTHPFTTPHVFICVPGKGIWALGNPDGASPYSHLWKP